MTTLFLLALAAGACLLWFLPVSKDRRKRLASQVGGTALFAVGIIGLVLQLIGPAAA